MDWTQHLIAEAQAIYDSGLKPTRVAERLRALYKIKVSTADVRSVITLRKFADGIPDEVRAELVRIRTTEWISYSLIAERTGEPLHRVEFVCRGLKPPKGTNVSTKKLGSPAVEGRRTRSEAERLNLIRMPKPVVVEVPGWVPDHLFEFYERTAHLRGEEIAASMARQLKHGGSVARL